MKISLTFLLVCALVLLPLSAVYAQSEIDTPTPTPQSSPTDTPTPEPPTPTSTPQPPDPTSTPTPTTAPIGNPDPTATPTNTPTPTPTGAVLGATTTLGDTGDWTKNLGWILAVGVGMLVLVLSYRFTSQIENHAAEDS